MPNDPVSTPSFSPRRRWGIALHVLFVLLVVFSVVVMANYLSRDYFMRFHVSTRTRLELSPRTVNYLRSMTNHVRVTLYYDKDEPLFSTIADLLNEYRAVNPRITLQIVDYTRDIGAAEKLKAQYKLGAITDKNLVIFDCDGRVKPIRGNTLEEVVLEPVPNEKEKEFRRKPVAFKGEMLFTACLLEVTNPKPLKAYFLVGHGEGRLDSDDDQTGYHKFASVLQENNIQVQSLSIHTNQVPSDCSLLVIPGPTDAIPDLEVEKLEQYLEQGGRLLALFNFIPIRQGTETGLEKVLAQWGVEVSLSVIQDPEHSRSGTGTDIVVEQFGKHPVVNPLLLSRLHLILPRAVSQLKSRTQAADAPHVDEIAFSGPNSFSSAAPALKKSFPLIVAVEKGAINGVITERGTTRIIVAGDSIFLANHQIASAANRDFAGYAANWLLDRTQLLEGLSPRPVKEFQFIITKARFQRMEWLLLAGMPGSVLVLGGLVWLKRRR